MPGASAGAVPIVTTKPPLGCALLLIDLFRKYLHRRHLPLTHQRETIVMALFQSDGHLSVDDLADLLHQQGEHVGKATIYRTLRLVVEAGLARELDFGEGFKRYEHQAGKDGYDHLVCTECGKAVRFRRPAVDRLQEEIAEQAGFKVMRRRLEIYGTCPECQTSSLQDERVKVS